MPQEVGPLGNKKDGGVVAEEEHVFFPLDECWRSVFSEIEASLRRLLSERDLSPPEIDATAKLKYALGRLPEVTKGVCIEASVTNFWEGGRGWLSIQITDDFLWIYFGESIHQPQGGDPVSFDVLRTFADGESSLHGSDEITVMIDLEDWEREWVRRIRDSACLFSIYDDGDQMDWEQPCRKDPWSLLADNET